jgi:GT2 family glycosyltransferase
MAESTPRRGKADDLREGLEEQRRDIDALANRVDSVLRGEDWIQAKLYDLTRSLDALVKALPGRESEGEPAAAEDTEEDSYSACVRQVREAVRQAVPPDGTVIVVSKGDEELLDLYGREAWHFPQDRAGNYAWHYPPDGVAPIAHLESLRVSGGRYLLFPEPALWWLHKYPVFSEHLHRHYRVAHSDETCAIFALDKKYSAADEGAWQARLTDVIAACEDTLYRDPSILDWDSGLLLKERLPTQAVLDPPDEGETLPYIDRSIDIVVAPSSDEALLKEARRVAAYAVVTAAISGQSDVQLTVELVEDEAHKHELPSASIIIPTYDGVAHLSTCLLSLDETLPDPFNGEVIVVDDGSGAEMQRLLEAWRDSRLNLEVVRNEKNQGFVASCNRGAEVAKSDFLVFLNDDTIPQAGWLQALLRTFREYPDAGAVGGRLLYPDGSLQEAGSLVFSDGSAANFGRNDFAIEDPLYNHVREVDYCSAALLATPRSLFSEIGGFDKRFEPGYYEDTDYCFEVRKHHGRVYYQPEAVVVHVEGGTGGTDLTAGAKRFQVVNHTKFEEKWKRALRQQPERPQPLNKTALYTLARR